MTAKSINVRKNLPSATHAKVNFLQNEVAGKCSLFISRGFGEAGGLVNDRVGLKKFEKGQPDKAKVPDPAGSSQQIML